MASGPNGVGVAVIIDEAEQIFSRRSDMQSAFSVKVEAPNACLGFRMVSGLRNEELELSAR